MLRGAIFDFDGTLFDSMFLWDATGEIYLRSIGYTPKDNLKKIVRNLSLYQTACYFQSEYGVGLSADEIMTDINRLVERYYKMEVMPKAGVIDFLERLRRGGVKMCIASATDSALLRMALERCQMEHYFSGIFSCNAVGSGKDRPDIFRKALAHLQTEKAETLVFEDSLYALETARKDGFRTVAVADRFETRQAELRARSDFYIADFSAAEDFWRFASAL